MKRDLTLELERTPEDESVAGVVAVHALYALGLDDEYVQISWPKLEGRPAQLVKALLANLEGEKPEVMQHHISEFAKHVKSMGEDGRG